LLSSDVEVIVNGDRSTTNRLLREARCLIMPIRWPEPFGLVMIEAMASGTPVVALRRGAVPEVVRHGRTGWICDDPSQLPRALLHAAKLNPDDCVAHVRAEFSADRMVRRYEQVYRKAIANAHHGRRPVRWPIGVARARPAPSVVGRAASQQILLSAIIDGSVGIHMPQFPVPRDGGVGVGALRCDVGVDSRAL
jgi:hypothetical protein